MRRYLAVQRFVPSCGPWCLGVVSHAKVFVVAKPEQLFGLQRPQGETTGMKIAKETSSRARFIIKKGFDGHLIILPPSFDLPVANMMYLPRKRQRW
jgi:hypothetical protein